MKRGSGESTHISRLARDFTAKDRSLDIDEDSDKTKPLALLDMSALAFNLPFLHKH